MLNSDGERISVLPLFLMITEDEISHVPSCRMRLDRLGGLI